MKLAIFLPALAVLGLSGCVTGYGYSEDGYYYSRPSASMGSYGGIGYGSGSGWRYGYGMSYGIPGGFGYGYPGSYGYGYPGYYGYYDPYYGGYYPRPPVIIIRPPPDPGDDDDDGDHDDGSGGHGSHPPPSRNIDDREPRPVRAARAQTESPLHTPRRPTHSEPPHPAERVRMPAPMPPMPRMDDDTPVHKGDRRR